MNYSEAVEYLKNSSYVTTGEGVYTVIELNKTLLSCLPGQGTHGMMSVGLSTHSDQYSPMMGQSSISI